MVNYLMFSALPRVNGGNRKDNVSLVNTLDHALLNVGRRVIGKMFQYFIQQTTLTLQSLS